VNHSCPLIPQLVRCNTTKIPLSSPAATSVSQALTSLSLSTMLAQAQHAAAAVLRSGRPPVESLAAAAGAAAVAAAAAAAAAWLAIPTLPARVLAVAPPDPGATPARATGVPPAPAASSLSVEAVENRTIWAKLASVGPPLGRSSGRCCSCCCCWGGNGGDGAAGCCDCSLTNRRTSVMAEGGRGPGAGALTDSSGDTLHAAATAAASLLLTGAKPPNAPPDSCCCCSGRVSASKGSMLRPADSRAADIGGSVAPALSKSLRGGGLNSGTSPPGVSRTHNTTHAQGCAMRAQAQKGLRERRHVEGSPQSGVGGARGSAACCGWVLQGLGWAGWGDSECGEGDGRAWLGMAWAGGFGAGFVPGLGKDFGRGS
jgi:hypothetical protein